MCCLERKDHNSEDDMSDVIKEIQKKTTGYREDIIEFMREIVAIPSMDSKIGLVGERIQTEMRKLNYDEVRFDKMGNTIGRIGNGKRVIVFDKIGRASC